MKQSAYNVRPPARRPRTQTGEWSDAATLLLPWSFAAFVCLACSFTAYSYRSSYLSIYATYTSSSDALKDHVHSYDTLLKAIDVSNENYAMDEEDDDDDNEEDMRRNEAIQERIDRLQKYIQTESHRQLVDRFGAGPYQVVVEVLFPYLPDGTMGDSSNEDQRLHSLTFKMAPLGMMPHAKQLFMEQVHHGLWDGCNFQSHSDGRILVNPTTNLQKFKNAELDSVSFQEYDENFPHYKYSIGFEGRPGGPSWYINTKSNELAHGPGGSKNVYALKEEADPCFARVIEGFDVIEKLQNVPTTTTGSYTQFLLIKRAYIKTEQLGS